MTIRKEYIKEYNFNYYRTYNGKLKQIYNNMKNNSIKRVMTKPNFDFDEFSTWCGQNKFELYYNNWEESDFDKMKSPSVDRLDDYKPYTFSNMRLITWYENLKKARYDIKNGINNKLSKSVNQINIKNNKVINTFFSISEAERETNIPNANIIRVCKGKRKSAGGYKWEYCKQKGKA